MKATRHKKRIICEIKRQNTSDHTHTQRISFGPRERNNEVKLGTYLSEKKCKATKASIVRTHKA